MIKPYVSQNQKPMKNLLPGSKIKECGEYGIKEYGEYGSKLMRDLKSESRQLTEDEKATLPKVKRIGL